MGFVVKWLGGIREKMIAIVNSGLSNDEKLLAWSFCFMYPAILPYIPVVGTMDFLKNRFLVAITNKRFLLIQISKIKIEELSRDEIQLSEIQRYSLKKWLWEYKLKLYLIGGSQIVLREISEAQFEENDMQSALSNLLPGKQL